MKIKKKNAGALSNFEVLDFLNSRGASKDVSRIIAPIAPSEFKVYDYLVQTPAAKQSREQMNEFMARCEPFNLAKAEKLNIINIQPSSLVELDPIIEEPRPPAKRFETEEEKEVLEEKLLELINEIFPPPPSEATDDANDTHEDANDANEDANDTHEDANNANEDANDTHEDADDANEDAE